LAHSASGLLLDRFRDVGGVELEGSTNGATMRPMSVSKRSVSIDDTVAARVERAADEDGTSFSAWLSSAAEDKLLVREGLRGVREWEDESGELTAEERAAGEALLDRLLDDRVAKSA